MKNNTAYDVIVVGAGAAGMMAAGSAAGRGLSVLLLEQSGLPGKKLRITGKGRCNLTNNTTPDEFLRSVKSNSRFLYSALFRFTPADTMAFFESLGVPLKTERGGRVFPVSDRAEDVAEALRAWAQESGAKLATAKVQALLIADGRARGVILERGETIRGDSVIVATGGLSYPTTGSTGDGYRFAKMAGHEVTALRASLVPLECRERFLGDLMGLSLKNVTLTARNETTGKPVFKELGEMLFTHFGVSGPLVLSASSMMDDPVDTYRLEIDLKPGLSPEELDQRILRDFGKNSNRDFINALDELLPRKLIPVVVGLSGIGERQKVRDITREQRHKLLTLLKAFPVSPRRRRPIEEAVITAGGVSVKKIDPKTMESKLVPGLFFAGEVLDLDALTGGYNLQIAFSTGRAAGLSAPGTAI